MKFNCVNFLSPDFNCIFRSEKIQNMESCYRLLHKSNNTHLQTSLPVYFYGMPNDNIYLIYARFYEINFNKSGLEFVFAILEEYTYDFVLGKIYTLKNKETSVKEFAEALEKTDIKIKIIKSYRKLNSFTKAQLHLNKIGKKMIQKTSYSFKLVS